MLSWEVSDIKIKYSRNYVVGQYIWLEIKFWHFMVSGNADLPI